MLIVGPTASVRPTGIGRFFTAAFLAIWLTGWLVGEVAALGGLVSIIASMAGLISPSWTRELVVSGGSAFLILFLFVWLTLWTVGGIGALTELLRSLWGEDVISASGAGVELVRRAGPFRKHRQFDRSAIRQLRIRPHDQALVVDGNGETHVLTTFGSAGDRQAIADWLHRHLQLPETTMADGRPPATWDETTDGDRTVLRKIRPRVRRVRNLVAWAVTGAVGWAWLASRNGDAPGGSPWALALTLPLAVGAAAGTWGRREWIVRTGSLTFRRTLVVWSDERTFSDARLEVTHSTDSDNDSHFKLIVADGDRRQTIHSEVNDSAQVLDLGRWLTSRTGFPLSGAGVSSRHTKSSHSSGAHGSVPSNDGIGER